MKRDYPDLADLKGYKLAFASLAQKRGGGTAAEEGDREETGLGLSAQSVEIAARQGKGNGERSWQEGRTNVEGSDWC